MKEIEVQAVKLQDVCKRISEQTDSTIFLDEALIDLKVSGNFTGTSVEQCLSRILKDENVIVEYNLNNKSISISSFGEKFPTYNKIGSHSYNNKEILKYTISELNAVNEKQRTKESSGFGLDTEFILGSNMTVSELDAFNRKQIQSIEYPDASMDIMLGGSATLQELNQSQSYQFLELTNNKNEVISDFGLTVAELDALHSTSEKSRSKDNNGNSKIPDSNITLNELNSLNRNQMSAFEELGILDTIP